MYKILSCPIIVLLSLSMMSHTAKPELFSNIIAREIKPTATPLTVISKFRGSLSANAGDYYKIWDLQRTGLSEKAFNYALQGYQYLERKDLLVNKNILSIVDFSKPSTQKRLYIINLLNGQVLFNTLVAHGRQSGTTKAEQFSNRLESHQSSLGFYITLGTYEGSHGYSLKLKGCEKGINDKAQERAIVLHGAGYVSQAAINELGFLGRSYGCPAVPDELSKEIIDVVKNGSCMFIYHPSKKYAVQSKLVRAGSM